MSALTCNCPHHRRARGEEPRRPVRPAPFPGSTIRDRFEDWQDAVEDQTCTRPCGLAINDVCFCRCRGLHHNAAHDYWATIPPTHFEVYPGGSIDHGCRCDDCLRKMASRC